MAYIFLDDGGPEAEEYHSNYFHFNDGNPDTIAALERMLTSHAPKDAAFRSEFNRICQASFDQALTPKSYNSLKAQ